MQASLETGLSAYVCDLDFSSLYPSIMRATNSSRMTLRFAPYEIVGLDESATRRYFTNLVNVRENAELLCSEYHGLPSYYEMKQLVEFRLSKMESLVLQELHQNDTLDDLVW